MLLSSDIYIYPQTPKQTHFYELFFNVIDNGNLSDDCIITASKPAQGKPKRSRKMNFSQREVNIINNNEMLTDESINLAQQYIKSDFPNVGGLFDTSLLKWNMQDVIPSHNQYIQIVNLGNLHWICVASFVNGLDTHKVDNQHHFIYDSLPGSTLSDEIKSTMSAFSFCEEDMLVLEVQPVQKQNNGVDCGVFAIAFATALANGKDPTTLSFDVPKMRDHLVNCLKQKKMKLFPTVDRRVQKCKKQKYYVSIYCHCRLPYFPSKDKMAQCDHCKKWYHYKCEGLKKSKRFSTSEDYICKQCMKKGIEN